MHNPYTAFWHSNYQVFSTEVEEISFSDGVIQCSLELISSKGEAAASQDLGLVSHCGGNSVERCKTIKSLHVKENFPGPVGQAMATAHMPRSIITGGEML